MKKYAVGIYILRAEPDHLAHHDTITKMQEQCEKCIISIGSHNRPRNTKNPFTSQERQNLIYNSRVELTSKKQADQLKFQVVRDYMYNDYKWAAEVYHKALTNGATERGNTCLFGHFKDDSSYYLKMFPQWSFESLPNFRDGLSATNIRTDMFGQGNILYQNLDGEQITKSTYYKLMDFRKTDVFKKLQDEYNYIKDYKRQWENSPFPPVFVTTDCVVVKSGHVLLIKRGGNPGKGLCALPGGFLDPHEKAEAGALRELKEETRIDIPIASLKKQVIDSKVFDHPQRSLRGRTITHAFLIDLGDGKLPSIKAGDDAAGARWVPLADAYSMENSFFEDHYDIIFNLTSRF